MRTRADLRDTAARNGLRVEQVEEIPTADGRMVLVSRLSFTDPWDAARYLVDASEEDADDPVVRQWALAIMAACRDELGEMGPTRSPELLACTAQAIHANVQSQIAFIHEKKETFQSARETMALEAGDCDDHARLVKALGLAANLPATLAFFDEDLREVDEDAIDSRHGAPEPVHVAPKLAGEWAETTIGADFGENPYAALERLEVETGENPMAHAPSMTGIGLASSSYAEDLQTRIATQSTRIALAVEGCTSLDAKTRATWDVLAQRALTFSSQDPAVANPQEGISVLNDLNAFTQTLIQAGCSGASDVPNVPVPAAPLVSTSTQAADLAKIALIAAAVIAAAFAVREVAKVVPRAVA